MFDVFAQLTHQISFRQAADIIIVQYYYDAAMMTDCNTLQEGRIREIDPRERYPRQLVYVKHAFMSTIRPVNSSTLNSIVPSVRPVVNAQKFACKYRPGVAVHSVAHKAFALTHSSSVILSVHNPVTLHPTYYCDAQQPRK